MAQSEKMLPSELKTALFLAGIYASRMMGLFLIFPSFSLLAQNVEHATPAKIGIALGIYSLAQAILQIPAGILSDIIGRKKVLYMGLALFLIGSILAASTNNINTLIIARLIQGSGAVSAVCLAFVADSVRGSQHGKVMAIIGMSIASSFIIAFILGSVISHHFGLHGLFLTTSFLAVISIVFTVLLPKTNQRLSVFKIADFIKVAKTKSLIHINLQIAALHLILSSSFFIIPILVKQSFGEAANPVFLYMPAILIAFIIVLPMMRKRDQAQRIMPIKWLILSIALLAFAMPFSFETKIAFIAVMTLFFLGFTYIEAMLPSTLFTIASNTSRGATSGIYSVYQFVGNFLGGIIGSSLYSHFKQVGAIDHSFYVLAAIAITAFILNISFKSNPIQNQAK